MRLKTISVFLASIVIMSCMMFAFDAFLGLSDASDTLDYEYFFDETGMISVDIIPHLCDTDGSDMRRKLYPSLFHSKLMFLKSANLQKDKCMDGAIVLRIAGVNHVYEVHQDNWTVSDEEDRSVIPREYKDHFDGFFPLGEGSFVWNHFDRLSIYKNSLLLSRDRRRDIKGAVTRKRDHLNIAIDRRVVVSVLDRNYFVDSVFMLMDTALFFAVYITFTVWCLAEHGDPLTPKIVFVVCVLSTSCFIYYFLRFFLYEFDYVLEVSSVTLPFLFTACVIGIITTKLFAHHSLGFLTVQLQFITWSSLFFANAYVELFTPMNMGFSMTFITQCITSWYAEPDRKGSAHLVQIAWSIIISSFLNFPQWISSHRKVSVYCVTGSYVLIYGLICPLMSFVIVQDRKRRTVVAAVIPIHRQ